MARDSSERGESVLLVLLFLGVLSARLPGLASFPDGLRLPGRALRGFTGGLLCIGKQEEGMEVVGLLSL